MIGMALVLAATFAQTPIVHSFSGAWAASSHSGSVYGGDKAFDKKEGTWWASGDKAVLPQWLELSFDGPTAVDMVRIWFPDNDLYSRWKTGLIEFSEGDPVRFSCPEDVLNLDLRFPVHTTTKIRVLATEVHEQRHYVGIAEICAFLDPGKMLSLPKQTEQPLPQSRIDVRGGRTHPCVNFTPEDVIAAQKRIEQSAWARQESEKIVGEANRWLAESDDYWLKFLPKPGACYAYGVTGCPICNGKTGTWDTARCTWDNPGHVSCVNGHVLPDADHPDDGNGYTAPDGRLHYFAGQFNAWVTEQWTRNALPALSQAYALTSDERYAERAALLLDALASIYAESTSGSWDYPSTPPSGRFARPWYQVARTLVLYVDQYDLIHNSPALDRPSLRPGMDRHRNIEQYMLQDGAYYCYKHSFKGEIHNGHADYLRGALAVGCLLDIPEYVRFAVEGPYSIHAMLANNIDRDGRYYETSVGYAIHARQLYLTFADPLRNLRTIEHPQGIDLYGDRKFAQCILLPEMQVMMAGRIPNFGDSAPETRFMQAPERPFSQTDYAFLERLYAMTADETRRKSHGAALRWLAGDDVEKYRGTASSRNWLLWHAGPVPGDVPAALPSGIKNRVTGPWVAGMKGLAILRDSRQAALVRFGPTLNHGDPDELGLLYYADGYEWTYEIGYGMGSTHTQVGWGSSTVSHCLVSVNEKKQLLADGSGGSLRFFADLPGVKVAEVEDLNAYASEGLTEYRRLVALVDGAYLLDIFTVTGGTRHDYVFSSMGNSIAPFGVEGWKEQEGSLAEGVAWGQLVGADGDIRGYPNKPYWNPPPGNGYGFFYNVRRGMPGDVWGATWTVARDAPAECRIHLAGDASEAILAEAPGLYPNFPVATCAMARRMGSDLHSTFIMLCESWQPKDGAARPRIAGVRRIADRAVEVRRTDGQTDVLLAGPCKADSVYGPVEFDGDFGFLSGDGTRIGRAETLGATHLAANGVASWDGEDRFSASVTDVDFEKCSVTLDAEVPGGLSGSVAIFSNPSYSRSAAYHVSQAAGKQAELQASTLTLGQGRVCAIEDPRTIVSDIPHEYALSLNREKSTRFFDGKRIRGEKGGCARIVSTRQEERLRLSLDNAAVFSQGERFVIDDVMPGDTIKIELPRVHAIQ